MKDKILEQISLQEEIQNVASINIVNCGNCGSVVLHRIVPLSSDKCADISCPYCNFVSEPCDFPDFLYSGIENSLEFQK
jgi:DNA-directed RNA polymerase subunit RPC12/RpoP